MRLPLSAAPFCLCALLALPTLAGAAPADSGEYAPPTPEQLAARERIRPKIEAIFKDARGPWKPGEDQRHFFVDVTDRLIALGPDAVPFLAAELDLMDAQTFHFCAYALGRIGGPEAEKALRKAEARADERGGGFGEAAKRFAVYGLALMGKPDVVDLLQEGLQIQGAVMLPDLDLISHFAMLTAPACLPNLLRQLDTYEKDPDAAVKLSYTIQALGYVADASLAPRIEPFLDNPNRSVREQAALAYARIAPPKMCTALVSRLGKPELHIDYSISDGLALRKFKPCYKQYLARLEVEPNLPVQASLLHAIGGIGGPSALDAMRTTYERAAPPERAIVLETVGRIGSPLGLNLCRSGLASKDPDVLFNAIGSIARIGGPGAIDTLLALVEDRRRSAVLASIRELEDLRVRRAGPRTANRLLELIREPIGDLDLRSTIAELTQALVIFEYTDPVDDIAAAAAKQTDPGIRGDLDTCVRRLTLLKTNGDDVAKWAVVLAADDPGDRTLAADRLAEIGTPAAVAALAARLAVPAATPDDRAAIFGAIGDLTCRGAADLVTKNLADPAYDAWELREARTQAAWAARRIGGSAMIEALKKSAIRRSGRDWATLVYLAILDPSHAADTLAAVRIPRLRYPDPRFGHEDQDLEKILFDLRGGIVPRLWDVPPYKLGVY